MRHQIASDWDELRQRVRSAAAARGVTLKALATEIGYARATIATTLSLRRPPSARLQGELRDWVGEDGGHVAQAAGGASEARADAALQHACATPATAPPSWDPSPHPLMCAPSAKIPVAAAFVSSPVTAWEYVVVRLPDHDWAAQDACLSGYGAQGWELVSVSGGVAYLRRVRVRGV